jgi:primary-amine oxidase
MIDGLNNSIVQSDFKVLEETKGSDTNYLGNGWTSQREILKVPSAADYSVDTGPNRTIVNPLGVHYSSGLPVGYKIVCRDFTHLLTPSDSIVSKRASFATHRFHAVP